MKRLTRITLLRSLLIAGTMLAGCDASTSTAITDQIKPETVVAESKTGIVMYKSEGCECCTGWAEHMRKAGFSVTENKQEDMSIIKSQYGVSENLASCHTATVSGYIIEGHVPASDVARLLKERPANVIGLTAPGMPMKSPGMQKSGQTPKGYDVLAFNKDGKSQIFTRYYADGKFREFMR